MTRARTLAAAGALAAAVALGACGPYAPLAQKLDVTAQIAGDTWVAAVGPGRTGVRVLVVARPDAEGNAPFAFSDLPSGTATTNTIQGTWIETGSAGDVTLRLRYAYTLPADGNSQRVPTTQIIRLTASRDGNRLVLSGDPALAGTYVGLAAALRDLSPATERGATCTFQIANLAVMTSQIRILGFGSNTMLEYRDPATYVGTVAGTVTVSVSVSLTGNHARTTITYGAFQDFGGVALDGSQYTDTTLSGDGQMSGVLRFTLTPAAVDPGGVATPIQGSIDYGANAIQIRNRGPAGGAYAVSIDGGGTAVVPYTAVTTPSSAVADCLALP